MNTDNIQDAVTKQQNMVIRPFLDS